MIAFTSALFVAATGIPEWVPKLVNLAIFLAIIGYILRKPMTAFFENRTKAIMADLERAKRERDAAEAKLAEVDARLAKLADESAAIKAEAASEAEAEYNRVVARAGEEAKKIGEAAEREIDGALKAAKADLQRFTAEKAVELAEARIRASMGDADRKRLVDTYAERLEEVAR
jgi:F0F1-type ATP synthase membrane subunit b/b'